ncbi:hypothetical protein [Rouxiella sp. S1S-2]|uniref:hypothetical protein n=1 Tax=Rouxiella sp. S1S-2 TaxID=2653856 RepID=UPI00186AE1CE|nr:hypothetical protein [Rouxiella sp. S1S-2]
MTFISISLSVMMLAGSQKHTIGRRRNMINRFTLIAITAALTLTGCAKITAATSAAKTAASAALTPAKVNIADFSSGPTVVTVTHVPALADDGAPVYVTVDGTDAGILAIGQTVELHVSAGKHQIGGYARSMVGRVTIPGVEVTTAPTIEQHVNYSVTDTTPKFSVRPSTKVMFNTPAAPAAATVPTTPTAPTATTVPSVPTSIVTPTATTTPAAATGTSTTTPSTSTSPTTTTPAATSTPTTNATPTTSGTTSTPTSSAPTTSTPETTTTPAATTTTTE